MSLKKQHVKTSLTYAALDVMINRANDQFNRAVQDFCQVHRENWKKGLERRVVDKHAADCEAAAEAC